MVLCHPNSTAEPGGAQAQLGLLLAGNGRQGPFPSALQQQQRQQGQALVKQQARLPNKGPEGAVPNQVQGQRAEQQTAHAQGASRPAHVRQHPSSSGAASGQLRQLAGGPIQQQTLAAQRHTAGRRAQQAASGRQQVASSTAGAACRAAAAQPAQEAAAGESGGPQVRYEGLLCLGCLGQHQSLHEPGPQLCRSTW